nr:hypothetical protein Iba_chr14eCG4090 [Ipomoea batatas]
MAKGRNFPVASLIEKALLHVPRKVMAAEAEGFASPQQSPLPPAADRDTAMPRTWALDRPALISAKSGFDFASKPLVPVVIAGEYAVLGEDDDREKRDLEREAQ